MPPEDLNYATVHKTRKKGRVAKVDFRIIFGTPEAACLPCLRQAGAALENSPVSNTINTSFLERYNGPVCSTGRTDRNRNARKVRKTYCFSKDWQVHDTVTYFTMFSYNFCWPVRTLRLPAAGRSERC